MLIIHVLLLIFIHEIESCLADARCSVCTAYSIHTNSTIVTFYNCDQCKQNSSLNSQTNACQCSPGFYQVNYTLCSQCASECATCSSPSLCTSCYFIENRVLVNGQCLCAQGYQQKNGQIACKQKPNVIMIVLSTIGSAICAVLGFIVCAFVRMRRVAQQIHAETRKKGDDNRHADIQLHYQEYDGNMMENSSHLYWNAKNYQYKGEQLCSICLDTNPLFMTDCGHYFHSKCIYSWLQTKNCCPNCNKQASSKQIRRWCQKCKKVLMPVVMNITIKRPSTRKKQDIIQSSPIQNQLCDLCQSQCNSNQMVMNEKNSHCMDIQIINNQSINQ